MKKKTLLAALVLMAGITIGQSQSCVNGGVLYVKGTGCTPASYYISCTNTANPHEFHWDGLEWPCCPGDMIWAQYTNTCASTIQYHMMTTTFVGCVPVTNIQCNAYCTRNRLPGLGLQFFWTPTVRYGSCIDPCCGHIGFTPLLTCTVQGTK